MADNIDPVTIDRLADSGKVGILMVHDALAAAYGYARLADDTEAMTRIEAVIKQTDSLHEALYGLLPPKTRAGGGGK